MNSLKILPTLFKVSPELEKYFFPSLTHGFEMLNQRSEKLGAKQLAGLTCLLEIIETAPGGPYQDENGHTSTRLNQLITSLLQKHQIYINPEATGNGLSERIINTAQKQTATWPEKIKAEAKRKLEKTIRLNHHQEITLFAHHFHQGLRAVYQEKIDKGLIINLGLINLYYWTGYTILDNIFDQEEDVNQLFLALEFKRLSDNLLDCLSLDADTKKIITEIFSQMHQGQMTAPTQVLDLSQKSLAQAIGPLVILAQLTDESRKNDLTNWLEYARCYLSIRQLHDDLSDQETDRENNRSNYVNDHLGGNNELAKKEITRLLAAGKKSLRNISALENPSYFLMLLGRYELSEQKASAIFQAEYRRLKAALKIKKPC